MIYGNGNDIYSLSGRPISLADYNPLNLPPFTIRLLLLDNAIPTWQKGTFTQVSSSPNIWDCTYENPSWYSLLNSNGHVHILLEVLGANTTGVTSMEDMFQFNYLLTNVAWFDTTSVTSTSRMFYECNRLKRVPLFDTRNVRNMFQMFKSCLALENVPLFNTKSAVHMDDMFIDCYKVQSGALALYQQASTQATPPTYHSGCFSRCGRDTTTGAAELLQIPSSWGGKA